jgi:pimeloyl-ACP methyl ester carboxylesterase
MRHAGLLYDHAETLSVCVDGGPPIEICVSRPPAPPVPEHPTPSPARPRLVLLHGNPSNMHDFGPLAARLAPDFELLALDLPGFGRSQSLPAALHDSVLASYAHHIRAALVRAGWTRNYHVLGHSHGAGLAQTLAVLYPEEVSGLLLLAAIGTPAHWGYRQLALPGVTSGLRVLARGLELPNPRALRKQLVRAIMTPIFSPHPVPDAWIDVQLAVIDRRPEILVNMALVATGDPCARLGHAACQIRTPTLFVHGDSDRLVPASHARAIYDRISGDVRKEFHALERAGHMLQITHAEEVASLLSRWIQRQ